MCHGAPQEHKGPGDFHGGADDDDDEDVDGTPPRGLEGSVEPQMMPPQYPGQPPFARLHHHTPSASPPITGMAYVPRGHTPQPQMGSRPSSRNDFRRPPSVSQPGVPQPPPVNGYAFMPQPAIYNPQNQANMAHGMPHQPHPQYPYQPPQPHPQMHSYIEEQRRASVPPNYPPQSQPARPHPSPPQAHQQQLPPQASTHMSPPQPPHQHIEPPPPPQAQHQQQIEPQTEPQPPPAPMEVKRESQERANQPFLDTASAIKKIPQRKQHSIFTPIDENRSILSQHLASFDKESSTKDDGNSRAQSVDVGAVARTNGHSSPPPPPQRSNTSALANSHVPTSSRPEPTFSPPSRSNSLKSGGGARPRLKVQIPDEQSDAGSNTAESNTSPRTTADPTQRNGTEPQSSVVVLPPPSPSASALLSAGATGPPNPFARPAPHSQNNSNMNIDTPVSALPSRFLNNEFLPSPSSFYPEWNFRGNDSNTLPSPLNFATPVVGSGPSFLRDDNPPGTNKRKSPEISASGPASDGPESVEAKRIKVDG
ncbi:resistance to lethality of mkk1p386 overexpression [Diatrype stigma]|uniref:Resistance to lethality of mkk1p386 overexpression n=1 Tax=Diatrype stigma TaxID=117547 RepID=A0AAN9UR59_9PEZI